MIGTLFRFQVGFRVGCSLQAKLAGPQLLVETEGTRAKPATMYLKGAVKV